MTAVPTSPTLDDMRDRLEVARHAAEAEGQASQDAMLPLDRLRDVYSRLTPSEQTLGSQILAEWLESEDENRRFDALALIDEFRVIAAGQALDRLADRLRYSQAPGAPFEREKISQLSDRLAGPGTRGTLGLPIAEFSRRVAIRSPTDLSAILAMIRASASSGHLAEAQGQGSTGTGSNVAGLPADGPWPDVIEAEFTDRAGRRYRLSVETYHGAGGSWTPLDAEE